MIEAFLIVFFSAGGDFNVSFIETNPYFHSSNVRNGWMDRWNRIIFIPEFQAEARSKDRQRLCPRRLVRCSRFFGWKKVREFLSCSLLFDHRLLFWRSRERLQWKNSRRTWVRRLQTAMPGYWSQVWSNKKSEQSRTSTCWCYRCIHKELHFLSGDSNLLSGSPWEKPNELINKCAQLNIGRSKSQKVHLKLMDAVIV